MFQKSLASHFQPTLLADMGMPTTASPSIAPTPKTSKAPASRSATYSPVFGPFFQLVRVTSPTSSPVEFPTLKPTASHTRLARILSLQTEVGTCNGDVDERGCVDSEGHGVSGNPNDHVNCYNIADFGSTSFFQLEKMRIWITVPLPSDLSVKLFYCTKATGLSAKTLKQDTDTYTPLEKIQWS
jgi:hypothetical protein